MSLHASAFRYDSSMHDTSVTQRVHSHAAWHSYALSTSHHRTVVELARPRIVDYIGPVHAGFVTVAPSTPHDVWHGVAWVTDTAAQHAADVAAAEQKKIRSASSN